MVTTMVPFIPLASPTRLGTNLGIKEITDVHQSFTVLVAVVSILRWPREFLSKVSTTQGRPNLWRFRKIPDARVNALHALSNVDDDAFYYFSRCESCAVSIRAYITA